jgi:hypothetical protein
MHQNHTNFNVGNNDPVAAGDRYWAHDLIRDFQYTRGLAGQLGKAIFEDDLLLSGADTIVKSGNNAVTIGEVYGICETSIDVPDDEAGWQIPKSYKTDKIYVVVHVVNKTVPLPDGNGTIRLRYTAENGSQRQRLFAEGEYTYFQSDDAEVIADSNTPNTDELVIASYANAGTNLIITPQKTKMAENRRRYRC